MKTLNKLRWIMAVAAMGVSLYAQAYPGESIVLDPVTGDYRITYWDDITYGDTAFEQPSLRQTTFVPATKIDPTIVSKFKLGDASLVIYSYAMSNGAAAKQAIVVLSLEQTERVKGERDVPLTATATVSEVEQAFLANTSALNSPASWSGNIYRLRESRIVWSPDDLKTGGVPAGSTQAGFSFSSLALPGLSVARMEGIGGVFGYAGEGPVQDSAIRPELDRLTKNDFIARSAAVPTLPVPSPFDPAVTLERIQTHMHTWIAKQLLDAAFSAQLDLSFKAAIDAYRAGQRETGKKAIETMRELIKQQQPDADKETATSIRTTTLPALIDLLAARILFFDLNYVTERGS